MFSITNAAWSHLTNCEEKLTIEVKGEIVDEYPIAD